MTTAATGTYRGTLEGKEVHPEGKDRVGLSDVTLESKDTDSGMGCDSLS